MKMDASISANLRVQLRTPRWYVLLYKDTGEFRPNRRVKGRKKEKNVFIPSNRGNMNLSLGLLVERRLIKRPVSVILV